VWGSEPLSVIDFPCGNIRNFARSEHPK
jgi:hypothetical protein